jgi:GNAT superfamily N-acetyltransferase
MNNIVSKELNEYQISTDVSLIQTDAVHHFLSKESYWAKNIPLETVSKSIQNSFCVGVYFNEKQVGFARIVSDYATFGYLADVYILSEHRGKGLSKGIMDVIMSLDWVKKLRRFSLATVDAHGLYAQYGFTASKNPDRLMEITQPGIYGDHNNPCQ